MFALNVTHFSNKPKDSNLFASYIAQRYATHKKGADKSLSGAPLVRMTLVFECMFQLPFYQTCLYFLLQIVHFVLDAYRLNKSPMNFN
ncbi:hypothetical protein [Peribacillus sp. YIM B13477]|uniref:hypothetical protein n=1 Tax=Peribacillus sp. YIM B13477 TaxID=3366300 RepID=UPI00366E03E4